MPPPTFKLVKKFIFSTYHLIFRRVIFCERFSIEEPGDLADRVGGDPAHDGNVLPLRHRQKHGGGRQLRRASELRQAQALKIKHGQFLKVEKMG